MQFITNGPDIPESLLQAQEEGRVVFFCGAGISFPAGLPGFGDLVKKIFAEVGDIPKPIEKEAIDNWQFDAALSLLEYRVPGQRIEMRKALARCLKPNFRKKSATETHAALLKLARTRQGQLRLVTTNFDRIFERLVRHEDIPVTSYVAPMLPIPKNSRFDGIVYLHGLLPERPDDTALNRLVVTSGDFGLAYLTERWAARFVSELFRNYVVCFVGYSLNDPVMRYMMDALAADRMLGEHTPLAYAFGDVAPGNEEAKTLEWQAKGVNPILYKNSPGDKKHRLLHQTLKAWAETYRDGVNGKSAIVARHALAHPSASTEQDDFVGRVLWALSDRTGGPAETFAKFNPAPTLAWLTEALDDHRFEHGDLPRFGVPATLEVDEKLRFSVVNRPCPYRLAQRMSIAGYTAGGGAWDSVMHHIADWLTRHLNDPNLILWIASQGGPRDTLRFKINRKLNEYHDLTHGGHEAELSDLRSNSPNAVPSPMMHKLWRLVLSGKVKANRLDADLHLWKEKLERGGFNQVLRLELREILSPVVLIKKAINWGREVDLSNDQARVNQVLECEVVLRSEHVLSSLKDFCSDHWIAALPCLLDDTQTLLADALDLQKELGQADDDTDRSSWDMPSIWKHRQNLQFNDWTALIELVRDSWHQTREVDPVRASLVARSWFTKPYAAFKRLALFAASHDGSVPDDLWVDWLTGENRWWLWSGETKRETIALLRLQGPNLSVDSRRRLESAILAGPERHAYSTNLSENDWKEICDSSVWLRLATLKSAGAVLSADAVAYLNSLAEQSPRFNRSPEERDEFSTWVTSSSDDDYGNDKVVDVAPVKAGELVHWLQKSPPENSWNHVDTWNDVCRKHMLNAMCALQQLAAKDFWPYERWRTALQVWSGADRTKRSWTHLIGFLRQIPEPQLQVLSHPIGWWLKEVSNLDKVDHVRLFELCDRILQLELEAGTGMLRDGMPIDEPVSEAINHTVGHVTQALVNAWFKAKPNDSEGLSPALASLFSRICDTSVKRYRHGRVILCAHLVSLFRVDRHWTLRHLLPLFSWELNDAEARAAWDGFLWSPRLYPPLMKELKPAFLQTASHYEDLGKHGRQFAAFMTYAALDQMQDYSTEEFRNAFGCLPASALLEAAQALRQAIEGAKDQREQYWTNRIRPFWKNVWPKSRQFINPGLADNLARLAITSGQQFPDAVSAVESWLTAIEYPSYFVKLLRDSGHCKQFPLEALKLLSGVMSEQRWGWEHVRECLDQIAGSSRVAVTKPNYKSLVERCNERAGPT